MGLERVSRLMISPGAVLVGVLWIVGCGYGTASIQTSSASGDRRFVLFVGGELGTVEGPRPLAEAKVVHANERLVFTISASRAVTVFVAYCDSRAKQQVYGPLLAGPNMTINVPQHGHFVVDHHAGREHVFIVASAESLRTIDPKLYRVLRGQGSEHPCADNLAMTAMESRGLPAEEAHPAAIASTPPVAPHPAAPSPAGLPPVAQPNIAASAARRRPSNYATAAGPTRVRGINPEEDTAATAATRSDQDGIAIIAFTFDHP
jgi:hypothetical protein